MYKVPKMSILRKTLYHGRPAVIAPARSRQSGLFLTEEQAIAEAYAGPGGKVIRGRIRGPAKILDASGSPEKDNWHRPPAEEWILFLSTAKRHGIDVACSVNYVIAPDKPLAWEAVFDTFDGLGMDSRLSGVMRDMGYDIILTSDYGVCIIGDINRRFGAGAAERVRIALDGRESVWIAIALKNSSFAEIAPSGI